MRSPRPAAAATALLLAGCVAEQRPKPTPVAAAPLSAPPPTPVDWPDLPLTPGGWRYSAEADRTIARFGPPGAAPMLEIRCTLATHVVTIARPGAAAALTIRTSYAERTIAGVAGGAPLAAADPLLDQIAFSRGRFSVAAPGQPLLVMPAWAEPGRVIEDCRG